MSAPTIGRFVWHELHTSDRPAASKFYTRLLSWGTKDVPMDQGDPYTLCVVNGLEIAGITKSKAPAGVPPHWLPYVAVDAVDATTTKAKSLGAKVLVEPLDIPNVGRFAVLADPQGASFCVFTPKQAMTLHDSTKEGEFCWNELMTTDSVAAFQFYSRLFGWKILPVGGIKEKTLAAYRAGVSRVVLPRANDGDLEDVPREVRAALTLVLADSAEDVMSAAFAEPDQPEHAAQAAASPPAS